MKDPLPAAAPAQWRSPEHLAETPELREIVQRELPAGASQLGEVDRRRFLQLSGASLGLAGLSACTKQPPEKIAAYVRQPEDIVPGKPMFYATSVDNGGYAQPVLAESHMGRPTKVEGNPEHPASLGATTAITQATVAELYDPDRSQAILNLGRIRSWGAFLQQVEQLRRGLTVEGVDGAGLAI
ncbi:MAG: TAT-variant-translocated molybdopterin oxidoreductase, partial [Acidobacteriota bacterium]